MAAIEVAELDDDVEVGLDLLEGLVPLLPALDSEVLVEQPAVHALDEAVGPRRAGPCGAMLDAVERHQQLVRVVRGSSGGLAPVVAEDGFDHHAEGVIEGQNPGVEQIGDRDRKIRGVDHGERTGTEGLAVVVDGPVRHREVALFFNQLQQ